MEKHYLTVLLFIALFPITLNCQFQSSIKTTFVSTNNQKFKFNKVDPREGLSDDLLDVVQDELGFLWVSALNGIYRYNGFQFKEYSLFEKESSQTPSLYAKDLFKDSNNGIWAIGSNGGLYHMKQEEGQFKKIPLFFEINSDRVKLKTTSIIANEKFLWISTRKNGLFKLNVSSFTLEKVALSDFTDQDYAFISTLKKDNLGNLWGVSDHLFKIQLKNNSSEIDTVLSYKKIQSDPNNGQIDIDSHSNIWIPVGRKIMQYIPSLDSLITYDIDPNNKFYKQGFKIEAFKALSNGQVWLSYGTVQGILVLDINKKEVQLLSHNRNNPHSISHNGVLDIYEDYTGIVWIATFGGGLNYYNPNNIFNHYRKILGDANALSSGKVTTFLETTPETIWVCTKDGLNKLDKKNNTFSQYYPSDSGLDSRNNIIHSIALGGPTLGVRDTNKLWLGTKEGLLIFDIPSGKFQKWKAKSESSKSLESSFIYFLIRDEKNTLWAITINYELFKFNETAKRFEQIDLLPVPNNDTKIITARPALKNKIWFWLSNDKGWFEYDLLSGKVKMIRVNYENDLKVGWITQVKKGKNGETWVTSNNGLFKFSFEGETPVQKVYKSENIIRNQIIRGIIVESDSIIWLSSLQNIIRLNTNTLKSKTFKAASGIQEKDFSYANYKSKYSETYYFGGNDGFNTFDPKYVSINSSPPQLAITSVTIFRDNNQEIVNLSFDLESQSYQEVHLFHGDRLLQIEFAALHFADPLSNQYAIKLDGYDKNWHYNGNKHEVSYVNLPIGKYTFRVKASNKDGTWNDTGISLPLIIHPPIWATWPAFTLYAILTFLIIYKIYQYQTSRNIEKSETRRLKELNQVKSQFFTNVAHELKTPLTLINGPLESIIQKNTHDATHQQNLILIKQNAEKLHNLIEEILTVSRMEKTSLKLEETEVVLYPFIKQLISSFEFMANSNNVILTLNYHLPKEFTLLLDVNKFTKIINNLISNALKFTNSDGQVKLVFKETDNYLNIIIQDNGIGISKTDLPYIFNRYYQSLKTSVLQGGTGIGLAICKEYIQLFNGKIEVQSEEGKGSTFSLFIPIKRTNTQAYHPAQFSRTLENQYNPAVLMPSNIKRNCCILIVEDNPDMQLYLTDILHHNLSCRVELAKNGVEALSLLEEKYPALPDLIISDVMMPRMDGYQLLEKLKENEKYFRLSVILITARSNKSDRIKGLTLGIDDYITKPFDQEELIARVANVLENSLSRSSLPTLSNVTNISDTPDHITTKDLDWINTVHNIIESNLDNIQLSTDFIADQVQLSERHLRRRIKQITGMTFGSYVKEIKLQTALRILESRSGLTISEISYKVGFNSPTYFTRVFKERFGKLPSDFIAGKS